MRKLPAEKFFLLFIHWKITTNRRIYNLFEVIFVVYSVNYTDYDITRDIRGKAGNGLLIENKTMHCTIYYKLIYFNIWKR